MKKVYSCLFIFIFLISCNTEPLSSPDTNGSSSKESEVVPYNSNNPYESAGRLHDELFETYYEDQGLPTSITAICSRVETIAGENALFISLKDAYQPITPAKVEYIVQHRETCTAGIIEGSSLSSAAKVSLLAFVNAMVQQFDTGYTGEQLYAYAAAYESSILSSTSLTSNDKRIILITASIARHSAFLARKKPKKNTDPDWTILVGNIIAGTEGAEEGCAKAVTMALATGIATN